MVFLWNISEKSFDVSLVTRVLFGMLYIPLLTSHFIMLRKLDSGISWILLVLVIGIVGDTVALYVGKIFGKKKADCAGQPG